MSSLQYTIRSIPKPLDKKLRTIARQKGKSLNQVVIEHLAKSTHTAPTQRYTDLDWIIGSQPPDPKFDEAITWLNNLPKDD